ncbi:MAG: hypothetical protein ABIR30_05050 [Chitinophagaceae bacterium]
MKSIISKTMALALTAIALFSFSPRPGGEGFEIFLNNKVVLQQYGSDMNTVKSLALAQSSIEDKLTIKYHHCGKVGKNRIVSIRDGQNKTLKEFHYADVSTPVAGMVINVKDILSFKKGNRILKLYYSSTELPNGRVLATLQAGNAVAALP